MRLEERLGADRKSEVAPWSLHYVYELKHCRVGNGFIRASFGQHSDNEKLEQFASCRDTASGPDIEAAASTGQANACGQLGPEPRHRDCTTSPFPRWRST